MKTITLDALIPREDFEIISSIGSIGNTRNKSTLSIEDLKYDSFFFSALRKPIFQRETNEWDANKVCGLIKSFISGELVPSIILWKNQGGYIFVIDGAHRLSSLGAWINDDYGDEQISSQYFGNYIPPDQQKIAEETRKIINEKIGSFKDIFSISRNPQPLDDVRKREIANNLGALALQVQWVEGNANKAEDSFLKINQCATKISDAELALIENREKAFAIAARAIVRAGRGYQYWSNFSEQAIQKIEETSKEIHSLMFGRGNFNTDDINSFPIGGPQSSNLTLDVVTQTVKICNDIYTNEDSPKGDEKSVILALKNTLKYLQYINSKKPCSLGIHPFIYFYSDIGKHKIGSYYGILLLTKTLVTKGALNSFITARKTFEDIIYQYSFLVQQIVRKYRQSKKAYGKIEEYYLTLIKLINENPSSDSNEIISKLKELPNFKYLQTEIIDNDDLAVNSNFSRGNKKQIKLQTLLSTLPKCPICGGYMDNYSVSVDHIERKENGGLNSLSNGQLTHLYCNTTYKN